MFRLLGILVVLGIIFTILMIYVNRAYLRPWRHRRHMEQIDRENEQLDEQFERITRKTRQARR